MSTGMRSGHDLPPPGWETEAADGTLGAVWEPTRSPSPPATTQNPLSTRT